MHSFMINLIILRWSCREKSHKIIIMHKTSITGACIFSLRKKKKKNNNRETNITAAISIDTFTSKLTLFGSLFLNFSFSGNNNDGSKWNRKRKKWMKNDCLIDGSLQSTIGNINIHHFMIIRTDVRTYVRQLYFDFLLPDFQASQSCRFQKNEKKKNVM